MSENRVDETIIIRIKAPNKEVIRKYFKLLADQLFKGQGEIMYSIAYEEEDV